MLTPLEQARDIVLDHLPPPRHESVPVGSAGGRFLAADVVADRDLPPADRSAMDGYAVIAKDIEQAPAVLRLVGEVAAGSDAAPEVRRGACARIFTGANVPPGADSVAIVETTEKVEQGKVRFLEPVKRGANIRWQGEDAGQGTVLLRAGARLGAAQISTCAAVGADPVQVYRVPEVAVVTTGAELKAPSQEVRSYQVRDSNGPALIAALGQVGVQTVIDLGGAPDELEAIRDRVAKGLELCDAVVVTGGVSMGDYDFVPAAVEAAGGRVHLHKVRMKPGKPVLFATDSQGKPVLALPGNPLSVLVSFWEFVAPALWAMMGDPEPDVWRIRARLEVEMNVAGHRTVLAPAHLHPAAREVGFLATPVRNKSSADQAAGARANGVVCLEPETGHYPAGSVVEAHPWVRPW